MAALRKIYPREYRIWKAMRARCYAKCNNSSVYQKRGIKVCKEWDSFASFIDDMGPCPESYTIDRINTYEDYSPENCRWASWSEQASNRGSFNRMYTYNGETLCLKEWARKLGIKYTTLIKRIKDHPELTFDGIIGFSDPAKIPIEYNGKLYSRKELCLEYGIPLKTFYDRYHKKWPIERIVNTPILKSRYDERNYFTNRKTESE